MALAPAFLDELRARVAVSTVVGRRVKLGRSGREMKGCCPFHNEKSPSFFVNDDKGFYHCFGCGVHGDVIRFVVEQEGLGFIDAVKSLAAEAGLDMPEEAPFAREQAKAAAGLHDITGAAAAWFAARLVDGDGGAARKYLDGRGIGVAAIADFGLGFAPDSRTRLRAALGSHGDDRLVETGLLIRPEAGDGIVGDAKPGGKPSEPYDRFRGRLMFPIRDPRGRVIGFGGRILGDGQPKYLNSPDTPLFDKGRTLYNLDRAGPVARKSQRLIVVEGYMDVIGLAQAGFADAVAPLGTALTETQLGLMWRVVPEPVLCFDGDAAGQRASLRAALRALPLLEPGKSLRFATLPPGKDPDDIVRDGGAAAFEALIGKEATTALHDVIWDAHAEAVDATTPEQKAAVQVTLRELAKSIANPDVRSAYELIFRDRFWRKFGRGADSKVVTIHYTSKRAAEVLGIDLLEQEMMAILVGIMNYPAVASDLFEYLGKIPHPTLKMKNLSEQIIEALLWAPDLDRLGLAIWLKDVGFRAAELDIRERCKLEFSFTTVRNRSSNAVVDLKQVVAAVVEYHDIQNQLRSTQTRSKAAFDLYNETLMHEIEATKTSLHRRKILLIESLNAYAETRPIDLIDPQETTWSTDVVRGDDTIMSAYDPIGDAEPARLAS